MVKKKEIAVTAHKVLMDNNEIGDNVSCTLPDIEHATSELKGAGIAGTIDVPLMGMFNSMTFSMDFRGLNRNSAAALKPGITNLELRFLKDTIASNGNYIAEGTKVFVSGYNKKVAPGKVETGASMDSSAEYEVTRYRIICDGVEVLLIDKLAGVYKVNGIDYMQKAREVLG